MNGTLTLNRVIAAPAERLFDAWLDADGMAIWMRPDNASNSTVQLDPRESGQFTIVMHLPNADIVHEGMFRVIDRPKKLVFTWRSKMTDSHDTIVTVTFDELATADSPGGPLTDVMLSQIALPSRESVAAHTDGWTTILSRLETAALLPQTD